jgi:multiple sugar transport system permease protein
MHEQDALSVPPQWIPHHPTLDNYATFFHPSGTRAIVGARAAEETLPGMANSLLAALGTAGLNLVFGTLAGYSLARFRFRGRGTLLGLYLGSRMLPGIALIVPLYLALKNLGLLDRLSALIVTYVTFTLPFTIWLLKNYFQTVPRALEEAAFMDGCNWLQMLIKVLLPAAAPGLVAAAMFAFMTAWSDYLFAVILTSTTASKTLPVVVAGFATDVTTERTLMATSGVLAIVPPLVLAFLFQRLIVQGLTSGAVKD